MLALVGAPSTRMSASEYLTWERSQSQRHEYVDGEVFAMAGGSPRHNALAAAIIGDLRAQLRGGPCRPLTSDQRIVARSGQHYVYPDVSVVCGPVELAEGTRDVLANPWAVVEVLSPSTGSYDRGDKWASYRGIGSLTHYLLVSQAVSRIEWFSRQPDGAWRYEVVEAGGWISLGERARLEIDALYDGVFELPGE